MRRTLIALLVASAASCGGPAKPTTPPPTLPDDKKPEVVAPVVEAPKPAPPPKDPDPIDVPLSYGKATYKLASAGKGQKAVIKIGTTAGTKQQLELALDFAGKQVAPAELGGTQEDVAPTLVLASDLEVAAADTDGTKWKVTFTGIDARERTGSKATKDQFKAELGVLAGVSLSGAVSGSGQLSNVSLHVPKPNDKTMAALELVRISMMPMWPIVPSEAIGVGAKWTVTTSYMIADRIEATLITDFELVSHKGPTWVLKGKTKLAGKEQTIKETKYGKIAGDGGVDLTLTDGAFVPQSATKLTNDFTASVGGSTDPKKAADPKAADPMDKKKKEDPSVQFHLEQALSVTPTDTGTTTKSPPSPATTPASTDKGSLPANAPATPPPTPGAKH
jgi:hypothetical protein